MGGVAGGVYIWGLTLAFRVMDKKNVVMNLVSVRVAYYNRVCQDCGMLYDLNLRIRGSLGRYYEFYEKDAEKVSGLPRCSPEELPVLMNPEDSFVHAELLERERHAHEVYNRISADFENNVRGLCLLFDETVLHNRPPEPAMSNEIASCQTSRTSYLGTK